MGLLGTQGVTHGATPYVAHKWYHVELRFDWEKREVRAVTAARAIRIAIPAQLPRNALRLTLLRCTGRLLRRLSSAEAPHPLPPRHLVVHRRVRARQPRQVHDVVRLDHVRPGGDALPPRLLRLGRRGARVGGAAARRDVARRLLPPRRGRQRPRLDHGAPLAARPPRGRAARRDQRRRAPRLRLAARGRVGLGRHVPGRGARAATPTAAC